MKGASFSQACKYYTRLERHARNKHSSLLGLFIIEDKETFNKIDTKGQCYKTFISLLMKRLCLSIANLSSLSDCVGDVRSLP